MSYRFIRASGLAFVLALGLSACEEGNLTAPLPDEDFSANLALSFEQEASVAERAAQPDRAQALRDGAQAFRFGVRPSDIEVQIKNEKFIYKAIVVGRARTSRNGERVLVRSLLAWLPTDGGRPAALLKVTSRSDEGIFANPNANDRVADVPGLARGLWKDIVNQQAWVATAGSADMELEGTGAACPTPLPVELSLSCVLATWDIRINGNFEPVRTDGGEHLEIHTNEGGVNGVVITPTD